jgi:tetratricopeptide (TPR) repeat protein
MRPTGRVSLGVCLFALAAAAAPGATAAQLRAPGSGVPLPTIKLVAIDRLVRLEHWLKAAARHAPGEEDEALAEVAAWPNASLQEIWTDATILVRIMGGRGSVDRFSVRSEGQKTATHIRYTKAQLHRLSVLACAAGGSLVEGWCAASGAASELDPELMRVAALAGAAKGRGDDNYIVRRGALLHSDLAMIAPPGTTGRASAPSSTGPQRWRMEISDGREVDFQQSAVHWEIARMLLDFVKPRGSSRVDPGKEEMVRQWYRATAAWMQLREEHDRLHLDRARELFPADPDILFLSGCQRETYAGAPIQTAVRSAVLPTGVKMDVGSERDELRDAEALFRRALEIKPDHAEARMRHGRVLALLGRHADAAVELRRAVEELTDMPLLYYAALFLGAEEEALGNRQAARSAYEHAMRLAPRAQSPLLAISQLERRSGDRPAALRAIERLFALPDEDRSEHDDPWWWYYVAQARDANDLLEVMRQPFLSERLQ